MGWIKGNDAANAVHLARNLRYNRQLRQQALDAYGGKCACCGEARREFLALDHVNGGGNIHRKRLHGGYQVFRELRRQGFPPGNFRVLCANCNTALAYSGYCPHNQPGCAGVTGWRTNN